MGKRQKDPAKVTQKWANNLAQAGDTMRDGINAMTENPAQKAKAKKATMKARLMDALKDGGKYDQAMDQTSLESIKNAMLTKGVARATSAASEPETQQKMQTFMDQLLPFTARVSQEISQMPNATEADRDARMLAAVKKMRQFKRTRR